MHFRRSFQDWELEEVTRFLDHIFTVKVQEGNDSLFWKIKKGESLMLNLIIGL